jgi:GTP-binding protein
VGKSTLWNRIVERRRALVSDLPHTTRDRNIAEAVWRGLKFELVDTGGLDTEKNSIGRGIRVQAEAAIKEASAVLLVVDGKIGVLPEDRAIAKRVRALNPHCLVVVNKIDQPRDANAASGGGIYGLGDKNPTLVSGATGKGVGDLLDRLYDMLDELGAHPQDANEGTDRAPAPLRGAKDGKEHALRLVLMGRPNAGKSSITNSILGEERVIVSPIAHTTREPQDTFLTYKGQDIVLVDTAGMRKRARVERGLEEEGLERNRSALMQADIALLIFDATADPTHQDRALAGLLKSADKGLILVANKWDLVPRKTTGSTKAYETIIRQLFPFLQWAPMVFVSATENLRTRALLDTALAIQKERQRVVDYNALQRFLKHIMKQKRPMASLGPKSPYVYDLAQVGTEPPTFLVTVRGEKQTVHPSWLKFLEKRLREKFGYGGTPVVVKTSNIPVAKSERMRNLQGPGMEAVAGKLGAPWMHTKKKNVRWRR